MIIFNRKAQAWLATVITMGFFGVIIVLMFVPLDVSVKDPLLMLLGALSTSFGAVTQYFFGSSSSSSSKDQLLLEAKPNVNPNNPQ